ncbi:uncharacterized protein METZ01_LOCUS418909, partial [marine metagenome]
GTVVRKGGGCCCDGSRNCPDTESGRRPL